MIQFRRGSTKSWRSAKVKLAAGQPGYDKDKHKIKIGDGVKQWQELPYATGLFAEEILDSEDNAKTKKAKDEEDLTLITYGEEPPTYGAETLTENTVGLVYLQQIDEPEVDYVIASGTSGIWTYQKWKSGIAKCWGNYSFTTTVQGQLELFYQSATAGSIKYPFTFIYVPTETATIQSSGGQVLLANSGANTKATSGAYTIISLAGEITDADYRISMQVEGFWRNIDGNKD
jgi:hypothetical protein